MAKAAISEAPNVHAPPARLVTGPAVAMARGYQNFVATREPGGGTRVTADAADGNLCTKRRILTPIWEKKLLQGRHVLDLGANAGFFALWALEKGASTATAVDMDEAYLVMTEKMKGHLGLENFRVGKAQAEQWKEPADVVLALALVHWVYSCTADFGSLAAVVEWLARLTRYALIVEWVSPEDFAIAGHGHTSFNPEIQSGPYTFRAFRAALDRHFCRVRDLGYLTATRRLFVAYKSRVDMDLSGPLPLLFGPETLLASRWLTSWGEEHFWSRVYDVGDSIVKQASFDMGAREGRLLHRVEGIDFFPRVLNVGPIEGSGGAAYSTVRIEKIRGAPFEAAAGELRGQWGKLRAFVAGSLEILRILREKGIRHRDIHGQNILVREGKPVLLDFAWGVSEEEPYISPAPLGELEHACDVCGMGAVLEGAFAGLDPGLDRLILAMRNPDERRRVTDIASLRQMAADVFAAKRI